MRSVNRKLVREILSKTLDVDPADRLEILEQFGADADVMAEVKVLLAKESEISDFMSLPISEFSKDFVSSPGFELSARHLEGKRIGNYEIVGELGQGGMGSVYLARRVDGKFEQRVALKMLRREFNVEAIRRSFIRESEIQARLEHPNISRLLDVDTSEDGIPFFAMEYVEGKRIDEYCENEKLSVRERLLLFLKVCRAVAHAHQNLIVHRDIKPSNILVNTDGEPKLLDFGISKILDSEVASDGLPFTVLGAMTPEYASPEQLRGEPVTTATDVYSLGAVLYRLMTGRLPFGPQPGTKGKLLIDIEENDPAAPSLAGDVGCNAVEARLLKGDIDNIVLKALRKEPERRYATVTDLSTDVQRHLDGMPVSARPSTVTYRTQKFIGRNRALVTSVVLVILILFGGITISLKQTYSAQAAQKRAEQSFALARNEEEKSNKISNFMFRVFSYANPAWFAEGHRSGGQARVIDVLDELSGQVETEFANEIDVQAELHHRFGEVYSWVLRQSTGPERREYMRLRSRFHSCRALELRLRHYGEWHELVAKDLYMSAGCLADTDGEHAAIWDKAIHMFRGTNPNNVNFPHILSDYARRLAHPGKTELHQTYLRAVGDRSEESELEVAERYLREALPLFYKHYEASSLPTTLAECDLAHVLFVQEKWTDLGQHFTACQNNEAVLRDHYRSTPADRPLQLDVMRKALSERGISN